MPCPAATPLRQVADLRRKIGAGLRLRPSASSARGSRSRPTCRRRPSLRAASSPARPGRSRSSLSSPRPSTISKSSPTSSSSFTSTAHRAPSSRPSRRASPAARRLLDPVPAPAQSLGLSVLKLHKREGRVLEVSGLDLIDGTPVLDIKPYTGRDRRSRIRTGWLGSKRRPPR